MCSYGNHGAARVEIGTVSVLLWDERGVIHPTAVPCMSHTRAHAHTHLHSAAPLQTVTGRVPEADQTVLSTRQEQIPRRVRRQTPELICVTLNASQHKYTMNPNAAQAMLPQDGDDDDGGGDDDVTWTSTVKPSLNVPLRMKFRDVPTKISSPFPSDTALMVPY